MSSEADLEAFTVQVNYGKDKLSLEMPGAGQTTVAQLKEIVSNITGISPPAQKIIFRGRTLQNEEASMSELKVTNHSKMILLGRKEDGSEGESVKAINSVNKTVDSIQKKIEEIKEEVEGIEKGFLQEELVPEACRGLHKRCVTCSELLMQNTEKLDAVDIPASETMTRNKRKTAVRRIQMLLERADTLENRVDECRRSGSDKQ